MPMYRPLLMFALALPLAACAQGNAPKAVETTQTNEQGCTRLRSIGPQNAYADPAPIKQGCIGPYLIELPQNYFSNQMGTEHDGSFSLALEYPSLEPFKPGERMNLSVDVGIRTVKIDYSYISGIDVREVMKRTYTPMEYQNGYPDKSLDARVKGVSVYGLEPYYIDMENVRRYGRDHGFREDAPVMKVDWHKDWYMSRDGAGEVNRIIKCTSAEITEDGVDYRDGKLVKNKVPVLPMCDHTFILPDYSTRVDISYVRVALKDWARIEARARQLFLDNAKMVGEK